MTAQTWRERKQELLRLLAELSPEVYAPATAPDEQLHRALLQPDHPGSRHPTANGPTKRLRTVALSLDDFPPLSTLSSTSSLCRVELVRPASALTGVDSGGKGSVHVMKTVDKRWAFRMRAQQSHIHELAVLRLGLRDEETNQKRRIPRLVASFLSPSSFHIVLSHVPGGDLSMVLERYAVTDGSTQVSSSSGLQEVWVKEWMAELVDALEWLHSSGWAHRDVKPQNLLLDADGHLLLTDFGSAAPLLPAASSSPSPLFAIARKHCRALIGTPDYIAPEILAHAEALYLEEEEEDSDEEGGGGGLGIKSASGAAAAAATAADSKEELAAYGAEVDVWSSGIVMYELLFGVAPFYAEEIPETYDRIVRWQENLRFPPASSVSKAAEFLIRALLTNAESRPTFQKIRSHEFFHTVKWNQLRTGQATFQPPSPEADLPASSPSLSRSQRSFAQSFDVDSFMSSPGLSILKPSPTTLVRFRDTEQLYWQASEFGGLTTLPAEDEFERVPSAAGAASSGEIPEMASPPPSGPRRKATSSFETPARPRWSAQVEREVQATTTSRSSSSSRRISDGLEAWREMQEHAWSVSRSARKRSATSSGGPSSLPPPSSGRSEEQDPLGGLQSRHREVLKQLDDMDDKYSSLFALAAGQKSSPVR